MAVVAVGAIIAGAAAGAAAYAAGMTIAFAIGIGLATAAISGLMSYMAMNQTIPRYNTTDTATALGTTSDPKTVIPVVYGQQRVGGINVWKAVGKDTTYLVQIFALCEGQIGGFKSLYLDNKKIVLDGNYQSGILNEQAIHPDYRKFVEVELSVGAPKGHVFTLAQKYLGKDINKSGWPDSATGNNVAAVCVVMRKRNKDLQNQADILQPNSQLTADINGLLIQDLNTGNREASRNGPSQLLDYATNTRYGLGIPLDKIDTESFKACADHSLRNNLYSDGSTDPNATFKENLTQMTAAFQGVIFESFGRMTCRIDGPDVVQFDFNEDNISAGSVTLNSGGSEGYYNTLNVSYQDPALDYSDQVLRYPSDTVNDGTIAKDKRIIAKDITYRFVKQKSQLDVIASIERNKSLLKNQIVFSTVDAYTVQAWDVIRVNFPELQLQDSLWRVFQVDRSLEKGAAGLITITAAEYDPKVYTNLDYAKDPNNSGSNIPNASVLIAPKNLQVTSVAETAIGRTFKVQWESEEDFNRAGFYVQYAVSGTDEWTQAGFTSGNYFMIMNMDITKKYDIRVCATGLVYRSEWVYQNNTNPAVSYQLPKVTGLRLVNSDAGTNITTATQFEFAWDDQSNQKFNVNGTTQTFDEVFQYYEVQITGTKTVSYRTKNINFTYDFRMNQLNGLSREITIKVIAVGYAGMKSEPVQITAKNNQHPAIQNFVARTGISLNSGMIFTQWKPSTVPDFEQTTVQIARDKEFTKEVRSFVSKDDVLNFELGENGEGTWYVKAAQNDVFGSDNVVWTSPTILDVKYEIPFTPDDIDTIEDMLGLNEKLKDTLDSANTHANNVSEQAKKDAEKYADDTVKRSEVKTKEYTDAEVKKSNDYTDAEIGKSNDRTDGAIKDSEARTQVKITAAREYTDTQVAESTKALNQTIAENITEINGKIDGVETSINGKITTIEKNQTTFEEQTNQKLTSMESNFTTKIGESEKRTNAKITELNETVTTNDEAYTQRFSKMESSIEDNTTEIGKNTASISSLSETVATNEKNSATSMEQLEARVGDKIASVSSESKAEIDKVTNQVNSQYAMTVDANGVYAGFTLLAQDGPVKGSKAIFAADKFMIVPAEQDAAKAKPVFSVDTTTRTVYLDNAVIKDASIGTAKIADAAIDTAKIKDASITNGKITGFIQSDNYVPGSQGWKINKNGGSEFSNVVVRGEVHANSGVFNGTVNAQNGVFNGTVNANGGVFNNVRIERNCTVLGTIYAENIQGDIVTMTDRVSKAWPPSGNTSSGTRYPIATIDGMPFNRVMVFSGDVSIQQTWRQNVTIRVNEDVVWTFDSGNDGKNFDTNIFSFRVPAAPMGTKQYVTIQWPNRGDSGRFAFTGVVSLYKTSGSIALA
ncbi:phage tail tip fiber protein [Klebsiella quasipneumoniae]|uniref:phage tail tip fiber protein n=1 Tax=Klebsiella quasipneumoniae TaxID=1463165 RepID=UPI0037BE80FC